MDFEKILGWVLEYIPTYFKQFAIIPPLAFCNAGAYRIFMLMIYGFYPVNFNQKKKPSFSKALEYFSTCSVDISLQVYKSHRVFQIALRSFSHHYKILA